MEEQQQENDYSKREEYIYSVLKSNNLLAKIESRLISEGVKDPAAAIKYAVSGIAKDNGQYLRMMEDQYEPGLVAVMVEVALESVKNVLAARRRQTPPSGPSR